MEATFAKCLAIAKQKNGDYSIPGDAFDNFTAVEHFADVPTVDGLITRIMDKFKRACNLRKRKECVTDEKIEDTLEDLVNYFAIWRLYLKMKEEENEQNKE